MHNSSYSFRPIFIKLGICFCYGLKICNYGKRANCHEKKSVDHVIKKYTMPAYIGDTLDIYFLKFV